MQFLVRRQTSSFVHLKFKFKEHRCPLEGENSSPLTAPRKRRPLPYNCSELNSANNLYVPGRGFCPRAPRQESSPPLCKLTNTSKKKKRTNIVYHVSGTAVNTLQKLIHFCLHFIGKESGAGRAQNLPRGYSGWWGRPGVGMHLALDQRTSSCISSFSLYTPAGTRVHPERC